jgi:hypothetical protein
MIEEAIRDDFAIVVVAAGILVVVLIRSVTEVITAISRERSRREIAAYVAEGLMSPEQGERLIRSDINKKSSGCKV